MDCATALERLQISRTQLYRLRTAWLRDRKAFQPKASGGNHKQLWPEPVEQFLREILPLSQPLNYAFIADQLSRRFDFTRSRSAVAQHIQQQWCINRIQLHLLTSASNCSWRGKGFR